MQFLYDVILVALIVAASIAFAIFYLQKPIVKIRRKAVSRKLFNKYNGIVQRGPFKGLIINGNANTSGGNLGAKLFGVYEQEVMADIERLGPFDDVVNFGAADGYFSLGVLVSKIAKRSICFEMTEKGRAAIVDNALHNNVVEKTVVLGIADDSAITQLTDLDFDPKKALLLCDIEGAEFSVLTAKLLEYLKGAVLIVELHDRLMDEGLTLREDLILRLPKGANHVVLKSGPALWQNIDEIEQLSDNDRALLCSEGRKMLGEWLVVTF